MNRLIGAITPTLVFVLLYFIARALKLDRLRLPWRWGAWLIAGLLLLIAATYTALPVLLEDTETNIACVSALAMRAQQMYPAPDASQRYLLLYGPLTYLCRLVLFPLFGVDLMAFKLAGFLALVGSLCFSYKIARAYLNPSVAWIGTGAFALLSFRFLAASMWGRCDPFLVCAASLGVWAALRCRWLITALAVAALVDLKITGVAYAVPIFALLYVNTRWIKSLFALASAAVFALLPFLLPQISLANYVFALRHAAQHGLESEFLLRNIQYSWLLLLPILALLLAGQKLKSSQRVCFWALLSGLLLSSVVGSKIGAGSYHLLPHIAALLQFFCWVYSEHETTFLPLHRIAVAWVLTWLLFSGNELKEVQQGVASLHAAEEAEREIRGVLASHPGVPVQVGVGDRYEDPRNRYGFETVFHGSPYTLSYPALRDLQLGGVPIPASTQEAIASCSTPLWLIPKNQPPFAAPNPYFDTYRPAFGEIRTVFAQHYVKTQTLSEYDVWACRSH